MRIVDAGYEILDPLNGGGNLKEDRESSKSML